MKLSKNALTTVEAVRSELGIAEPDPQVDTLIARLINSSSDTIRHHCRRDFAFQEINEDFFIDDTIDTILLSLTPVVKVKTVYLGWGEDNKLDTYNLYPKPGLLMHPHGYWPRGERIAVTYTGGFVTPEQARQDGDLERDLPYDIEEACILTAVTRYQYLGQPSDIQIMQVEQIRVHFAETGRQGLPIAAQDLLDPFVRWT